MLPYHKTYQRLRHFPIFTNFEDQIFCFSVEKNYYYCDMSILNLDLLYGGCLNLSSFAAIDANVILEHNFHLLDSFRVPRYCDSSIGWRHCTRWRVYNHNNILTVDHQIKVGIFTGNWDKIN